MNDAIPTGDDSLLDPAFVRRLARFELRVRRRFAGALGGARLGTAHGASVEFADHRGYVPGDDTRRIDWNAFARLDEFVIRLYRAEEDLNVYLLVDTSRSLAFGAPPKIRVAQQFAAALAYVALHGNDRVRLLSFADTIAELGPACRGRQAVSRILRQLDRVRADGGTNLEQTFENFLRRRPRAGLIVLVSDLFDTSEWKRGCERAIAAGHELLVVHVLDREETNPSVRGDYRLVDVERGEGVDVTVDDRLLRAYQRRLTAFLSDTREWAARRGVHYLEPEPLASFEDVLSRWLGSRG